MARRADEKVYYVLLFKHKILNGKNSRVESRGKGISQKSEEALRYEI